MRTPSSPLPTLLIITSLLSFASSSHLSAPVRLLVQIENPCGPDQEGVDNGKQVTGNGCGSGPWLDIFQAVPYQETFHPCCQEHDKCYGVCAWPDFQGGLKKCNQDFRACNQQKCKEKANNEDDTFVKWTVQLTCGKAIDAYNVAVESDASRQIYESSQKQHCDCQ